MERQILNRDFYELFILDMHCLRNKGDVVLVPGIDQAASAGEIMDRGRILRIELNFEPEKTQSIADKFTTFAQSLAEIGQWYHRTARSIIPARTRCYGNMEQVYIRLQGFRFLLGRNHGIL